MFIKINLILHFLFIVLIQMKNINIIIDCANIYCIITVTIINIIIGYNILLDFNFLQDSRMCFFKADSS